jgi:FecR-like protein
MISNIVKSHIHQIDKGFFIFLFFLLLINTASVIAADQAGHVETIKGTAWAQIATEEARKLKKNSPIYANDKITTDADSTVQLRFEDNSKFFIGANSKMLIEKFLYKQSDQENSFSTRILKGSFRFITGLIARKKPESMLVNTTVATIGIRGTHVVGEADSTSATIILIEPEDTSRKTIIEVYNQYGSVTIDEPGYGTEIPDEFSPPSPPRRMRLQTINNLMRSMQSIQRMNIPRPRF